ncbi:threonine--tRNA ligase [Patescibacteria group bacterium]
MNQKQEQLRHSTSHIMAAAVLELFPEAKLGTGPALEEGFYYDFDLPNTFVPEDLKKIEKKMKFLIKQNLKFEYEDLAIKDAKKLFKDLSQDHKLELIDDIVAEDKVNKIRIYRTGDFVDLCAGPHIKSTKEIGAFKLLSFAGAYWKADENNQQMQRIYGIAFKTKKELDAHLKMLEEAKERDHRRIGKDLELFFFDDEVGPGLPIWLPNGEKIIRQIEKLGLEMEDAAGYERVRIPHIAKEDLFTRSGHLPYYADSMFPPMELENQKYYLKPMNCPFHHKIFGHRPRSYQELPFRIGEWTANYRYEKSGELFGLMRVRSMNMNDAHIYCSEEQFEEEFMGVIDLYLKYFEIFGIDKYMMRFSTHSKEGLGKKYIDNAELWEKTEDMVRKVMKKGKIKFEEVPDEAAFYGPKIDVQIWSAIGREFTLATNQVDFSAAERFDLEYTDKDGETKKPLVLHRAPLGTHERLIGFLIEHYAGKFPVWLAPIQARILPISDKHAKYATKLYTQMKEQGIRVEMDDRGESIGKKIRQAEIMKIPYMLVVGDREQADNTVAVRSLTQDDLGAKPVDEFITKLLKEIEDRK